MIYSDFIFFQYEMVDPDNLILCFQGLISLISITIGALLIFISNKETLGMVLITSIVGVWLPSPTGRTGVSNNPVTNFESPSANSSLPPTTPDPGVSTVTKRRAISTTHV